MTISFASLWVGLIHKMHMNTIVRHILSWSIYSILWRAVWHRFPVDVVGLARLLQKMTNEMLNFDDPTCMKVQ